MVSYAKSRKKKSSLFSKVLGALVEVDSDHEVLQLRMRHVDILRGEEFLNDIIDLYIEKEPSVAKISLEDIIAVLYENYLQQIKNGKVDHQKAANFLLAGKKKFLDPMQNPEEEKREFRQISLTSFVLEEPDDTEIFLGDSNEKIETSELIELDITINNRDIKRGKVFLYDINAYLKNEVIKVEDVIVISYLNLIETIRLKGNNRKIMESILYNLGYEEALE